MSFLISLMWLGSIMEMSRGTLEHDASTSLAWCSLLHENTSFLSLLIVTRKHHEDVSGGTVRYWSMNHQHHSRDVIASWEYVILVNTDGDSEASWRYLRGNSEILKHESFTSLAWCKLLHENISFLLSLMYLGSIMKMSCANRETWKHESLTSLAWY